MFYVSYVVVLEVDLVVGILVRMGLCNLVVFLMGEAVVPPFGVRNLKVLNLENELERRRCVWFR